MSPRAPLPIALIAVAALAGCPTGDDDDSAEPDGVTVLDAARAAPGYTLLSSRYTEEARLVALDGTEVHRWGYERGESWHHVELLADGRLAVIIKEVEGSYGGLYFELDRDGAVVREVPLPAHHDAAHAADGTLLLLCREYVTNDAIFAGGLRSDWIAWVDGDGAVVGEWHADQQALKLTQHVELTFPRPDRDWAHTNTVELLPDTPLGAADDRFAPGHVLFGMSALDTVGVFDGATGEITWAWGPGTLQQQHMPTMLADGHLLVFDNGTRRGWSRVLELDPASDTIVWEYRGVPAETLFTDTRGSAQRLDGGTTLIAESNRGRVFEVTLDGELVWEYLNPDRSDGGSRMPLYRAIRHAPEEVEPWL